MTVAPNSIEERVAKLERRLDELAQTPAETSPKDWRRTVGMFRGDMVMKEVIDEALRMREAERSAFYEQRSDQL